MIQPATLSIGDYTIAIGQYQSSSQPLAKLSTELGSRREDVVRRDINVRHTARGNILELALRFWTYSDSFGWPKLILIPETDTLFVAASSCVGVFGLNPPREIARHEPAYGYWTLERATSGVLLVAELELRAWDLRGNELWDAYLEPPHSVRVEGDTVVVDEADRLNWNERYTGSFPFVSGPPLGTPPDKSPSA